VFCGGGSGGGGDGGGGSYTLTSKRNANGLKIENKYKQA
jgi:hypothetical protein